MNYLELLTGDPDTFINQVWGRRILTHTAPADELAQIFGISQADHLITQTALRTPQLRLAQDGAVLAESKYTKHATIAGKPMTGLVDARKVLDLFSDGATIVFQGLQRYWEPLRLLVRGLEEALGHPCQANAYLTPPGSQGFALHSDSHDVITFQTFGSKQWEVHDAEGVHEVMMVPGLCLYLPTGTPHLARTQQTASLHVTVGINRYVWRDLLRRVVDPVLADDTFAGPLPADLFADPQALSVALQQKLAELAAALQASDTAAVVAQHQTQFATGRQPVLAGGLLDRLGLAELTAQTLLRRRAGSTLLLRPRGETLQLLLGDRSLRVPARITEAVRRIEAADRPLRPVELTDLLDEAGAVVLCRRLVREGLLEIIWDQP